MFQLANAGMLPAATLVKIVEANITVDIYIPDPVQAVAFKLTFG